MTANPDSALRQALVAAEKALAPFAKAARIFDDVPAHREDTYVALVEPSSRLETAQVSVGDLRRAREAHALITEALQQHNGEKV